MLTAILLAFLTQANGQERVTSGHEFRFFQPVTPPRSLQVMAHRGAMRQAPENSARAIELSIADTFEWVEVDVRLTKDGHHVLFHDDKLDDKTDGTGRVRDRTLAELKALDAGSKFAHRFIGTRILTLAEGLALARGRVNLYLDCKEIDPPLLAREVIEARMERQVVIYDTPQVLEAVRAAASRELALMTKWRPRFGITPWVDEVRPAAVEIDAADVTPEVCREFKSRGIKVQAKTLGADDRPEVWDRVAAAGVDWIQTDLAEEVIARQALKKIGSKPVKIAHHRGASRYAPENTLPALEKAIRLGADFVEFDLQTTRDGGFVLLHDRTLNRTTNGQGAFGNGTSPRSPRSTPVPGLAGHSRKRRFRPSTTFSMRPASGLNCTSTPRTSLPKPSRLTHRSGTGWSRGPSSTRAWPISRSCGRSNPAIRRMPPLRNASRLDSAVERVQPYAFDTAWSILSKELIDRCHIRGVKVFSDALGAHEKLEDYQRAIRDGIDLIQTDHPVRVLRAIELLEPGKS